MEKVRKMKSLEKIKKLLIPKGGLLPEHKEKIREKYGMVILGIFESLLKRGAVKKVVISAKRSP